VGHEERADLRECRIERHRFQLAEAVTHVEPRPATLAHEAVPHAHGGGKRLRADGLLVLEALILGREVGLDGVPHRVAIGHVQHEGPHALLEQAGDEVGLRREA
jgi:hypothetical protein